MQAIIIGAGRGQRLMPTTADTPKCFAEVGGRRILDWTLDAFRANGVDRIAFIGGYQIDKVRAAYPELTFRHNADWANNNILASLFHAEDLMDGPFVCSYSDILFTPEVVRRALASTDDMALVVDTDWRERYTDRTEHPPDDAEKVMVEGGAVTRVSRDIDTERPTASTSAWRSSRPRGRPGSASTTTAAATPTPASRSARPASSRRRT